VLNVVHRVWGFNFSVKQNGNPIVSSKDFFFECLEHGMLTTKEWISNAGMLRVARKLPAARKWQARRPRV